MRPYTAPRILLLLGILAKMLTMTASAQAEPLRVTVGIPPQQGLVALIAGPRIQVDTLVGTGQDPHTYEPTPRQLVRLAESAILFTSGMPFERALAARLAASHPKIRIVDVTQGFDRLSIEGDEHAHGSDCPCSSKTHDPHVWLAPKGLLHQARLIAAELVRLDAANAEIYREGLARLEESIADLDTAFTARFEKHKGQSFFVYHPAWGYFAQAYGLKQVAVERHGGAPGAKHLVELTQSARASSVRGILVQSDLEAQRVRPIADPLKLQILRLQPLGADPLQNLRETADAVAKALPAPAE